MGRGTSEPHTSGVPRSPSITPCRMQSGTVHLSSVSVHPGHFLLCTYVLSFWNVLPTLYFANAYLPSEASSNDLNPANSSGKPLLQHTWLLLLCCQNVVHFPIRLILESHQLFIALPPRQTLSMLPALQGLTCSRCPVNAP